MLELISLFNSLRSPKSEVILNGLPLNIVTVPYLTTSSLSDIYYNVNLNLNNEVFEYQFLRK